MHENRFFRSTGREKSGKASGKLADKVCEGVFALLTSADFETALKSFLSGNQLQSYPIALCEDIWSMYKISDVFAMKIRSIQYVCLHFCVFVCIGV